MKVHDIFVDPPRRSPTAVLTCDRCGSIDVEAIRPITNTSLHDTIESAWAERTAGRTGLAVRLLLRWASCEAANALRDRYRCSHCGFGFREMQP